MKKKTLIILTFLCLLSSSLFVMSVHAEDFAGKEDHYIKLCSSKKLTSSQQKTCKKFNTYLNDKNKKLKKEAKETKQDVAETQESIEIIAQKIAEYDTKIQKVKKEIKYINNNIKSLNKQIKEKNKLLEDRLYQMQTTFNSNMFYSYIMGANDFSDLFRRFTVIQEITSYENHLIEELNEDLAEVKKQKETAKLLQDSLQEEQNKQKEAQKKFTALLTAQKKELAENNAETSKNQESIETIQKNLAAIKAASQASKVENVKHATPNKKNESTPNDNQNQQGNTNNHPSSSAELGLAIANKALTRQGYMYVWGGCHSVSAARDPNYTKFDCSGLVNWAHYQCGVETGIHYTGSMVSAGKGVSKSQLQPGDIILFSSNGSRSGVHHVGIYIGNNQMVHAPETGSPVQVANLSYSYWQREWYTCRRLY